MLKVLFISVLLTGVGKAHAQNNIEVYRNGILGQFYNEHGKYDSAEKYLRKAMYLMPDKTRFGCYYSLIKFANVHNDTKKITEYLRELSCVNPRDTIYKYLKDYSEISMDTATFNNLYKPKCTLTENKNYAAPHPSEVDSTIAHIIARDQVIRKKVNESRRKTTRTEEEIVSLEKEMRYTDSTDFVMLYDCIKKYGFPDIETPLRWSRVTILYHIDNYDNFKKIDKYLLDAVKHGCLSPTSYAYALDRSLIGSKLKPKYYWLVEGSFDDYKPAQDEIAKVNHERTQIGLPPYPIWTGWGF